MTAISRAAVIAVGSELLTPLRVDTNSLWITEQLNAIGIEVVVKLVVGDDRAELAASLRAARKRVELVVCSGGLGPTDDDVTREVTAEVMGRTLREDPALTEKIRERFSRRGLQMPEINRRQAMVPDGAVVLDNPAGSAPGLWLDEGGFAVLLLPGPPRELRPMLAEVVARRLTSRAGGVTLRRRVVRVTGKGESHVDEMLTALYAEWARQSPPVAATILAALGQLELHLSARGESSARVDEVLERAVTQVQEALGLDVYSVDGAPLEVVVGRLLAERALRIAAAESCTGGLLTSRLTDVPGSSRYVVGTVVAYANDAKVDLLGVAPGLIQRHGAVSEEVARAMAEGIRTLAATDIGVGVTGVAGPDGGTPEKPVGLVAVAVATPAETRARTFRFIGEREMVKFQAAQGALDMVRRALVGR